MSWLRFGMVRRDKKDSSMGLSEEVAEALFSVLKSYEEEITDVDITNTRYDAKARDIINLKGSMDLEDFIQFRDLMSVIIHNFNNKGVGIIKYKLDYNNKIRRAEEERRVYFDIDVSVMHDMTKSAFDLTDDDWNRRVDRSLPASIYDL